MHVDPNRIWLMAIGELTDIKLNRVERVMYTAMIADIFEHAVNGADNAAFAADVARRARIAGGVFVGDHHRIADFVFAARFDS